MTAKPTTAATKAKISFKGDFLGLAKGGGGAAVDAEGGGGGDEEVGVTGVVETMGEDSELVGV